LGVYRVERPTGAVHVPRARRDRPKSHTPRPSNSFIIYRREKHAEIMTQFHGAKSLNNNVISKIVAQLWRDECPEVRAYYAARADDEKRAHMIKYPDYKYRPRRQQPQQQHQQLHQNQHQHHHQQEEQHHHDEMQHLQHQHQQDHQHVHHRRNHYAHSPYHLEQEAIGRIMAVPPTIPTASPTSSTATTVPKPLSTTASKAFAAAKSVSGSEVTSLLAAAAAAAPEALSLQQDRGSGELTAHSLGRRRQLHGLRRRYTGGPEHGDSRDRQGGDGDGEGDVPWAAAAGFP
ncbi:hypothetical protein DFJ73DRAFT_323790, partial [Zopfochytrium polystomum]